MKRAREEGNLGNCRGGEEEPGGEEALERMRRALRMPVSRQAVLSCPEGGGKALLALSAERSGNRLATGGRDNTVSLFDFAGGLFETPFRSFQAEEGNAVVDISHSPTGDVLGVATGSAQPRVFGREGEMRCKFVKGDMYLRDMAKTKGHVSAVTGIRWHPTERHRLLTAGRDGTLRLWDLEGGRYTLQMLTNDHVVKVRDDRGLTATAVTACAWSHNANFVAGGLETGAVHIWQDRASMSARPDISLSEAHGRSEVTGVLFTRDNRGLFTRGRDDRVAMWDLRRPTRPFKAFRGISTTYPGCDMALNAAGNVLAVGACAIPVIAPGTAAATGGGSDERKEEDTKKPGWDEAAEHKNEQTENEEAAELGEEEEEEVEGAQSTDAGNDRDGDAGRGQAQPTGALLLYSLRSESVRPTLSLPVEGSPIRVLWQQEINHLFCSTSAGEVNAFYDPNMSKQGCLLAEARAARAGGKKKAKARRDHGAHYTTSVGAVVAPNALPMYRDDLAGKRKRSRSGKQKQQDADQGPAPLPAPDPGGHLR